MFYRKDVLAEIGMEPPRTWDDVVAIADAIRAKGLDIEPLALYFHNDGNRQNLFIWLNFLWAAGADVFDENTCPNLGVGGRPRGHRGLHRAAHHAQGDQRRRRSPSWSRMRASPSSRASRR